MESWRILLHLAATGGYDTQQIDIKSVYLHGILPDDEVQYMEQPEGFIEPDYEDYVWMIVRGLYGMKQGGRVWNKTLNEKMIEWGFHRLECEPCIYYRKTNTGWTIAAVHVDDFLIISNVKSETEGFKTQLQTVWQISDLGTAKFLVGIAIEWNCPKKEVLLSQSALIDKIVNQFRQKDVNPVATPMEPGAKLRHMNQEHLTPGEREQLEQTPYRALVGSLLYLAIGTRPDISYVYSPTTLTIPQLLLLYPLECCNLSCPLPQRDMKLQITPQRQKRHQPHRIH
jgi:hypothetical protein